VYLTSAQARRIALAAQGIGVDRDKHVTMRQVQSAITRLGQFQIDSVNVLARAHTMPLFTRLGAYDQQLLTRAASAPPRRLFEFWGHAASLIDIDLYPAMQFRRDDAPNLAWREMRELAKTQPELIEQVAMAVAEQGPVTARDLDFNETRTRNQWGWNWSRAKTALEWLFWCGKVAVASRNSQFERVYDIPERVIPAPYLAADPPNTHDAHLTLVRRAARALGIGTAKCLGDYFRTATAPTQAAITDLAARGELTEAEVEGVKAQTWLWHEAVRPRAIQAAALVSPFDSLVFERRRLATFFRTEYSLGIYTPPDKRVHGYYVYLFLLGDEFVARTDLKADRANSTLLVQSAWLEPEAEPIRSRVATELMGELRRLADWLDLANISIADSGTLSGSLRVK